MYTIETKQQEKKLLITTSGSFSIEEAEKYISQLEATLKTINPSQYDLIIDGREQKVIGQEVLPLLEKAIGIYLATPFKSRRSVEFDSAVTKSQIKRLGKNELLENFTFHDSLEDALK